MPSKPHCPSCGYTEEDAKLHMDHSRCKNSGNAPWEKRVCKATSAPQQTTDASRPLEYVAKCLICGGSWKIEDGILSNCPLSTCKGRFKQSIEVKPWDEVFAPAPQEAAGVDLPPLADATKRTQEEWNAAAEKVCSGGEKAGIGFFTRHPHLGFGVAVGLQCDLVDRERQLRECMAKLAQRDEEIAEARRLEKEFRDDLAHTDGWLMKHPRPSPFHATPATANYVYALEDRIRWLNVGIDCSRQDRSGFQQKLKAAEDRVAKLEAKLALEVQG